MGTILLVVVGLGALYLFSQGKLNLPGITSTLAGVVKPCASAPSNQAPPGQTAQNLSTYQGGSLAVSIGLKGGVAGSTLLLAGGSGAAGALPVGLALSGAALGAATLGIGVIGAVVAGIFAHHSAAVQKEANTLNPLEPELAQAMAATVNSYNAGQIDASQATAVLDALIQQYVQAVSGIVKKSGPCSPPPCTGTGAKGFCNVGLAVCNSACDIQCILEMGWVAGVKQAIISGQGGVVTLQGWAPSPSSKVLGFPTWQLVVKCS